MSGDDVSASWIAANGDQKSLLTLAHKLCLGFLLSREVANFLCFPPVFEKAIQSLWGCSWVFEFVNQAYRKMLDHNVLNI
ncbi:unnamed protein product [Dicrocoelium dendriticum]|nr:unnamed protein product [Dicrocoelium dendriticum]